MDLYPTAETWTPGAIAPADGNVASAVAPASVPASGRQGPDADAHLPGRAPMPTHTYSMIRRATKMVALQLRLILARTTSGSRI